MSRSGWFIVLAAALAAYFVGRVSGPSAIVFPDPGEARSAAEMEREVAQALEEPRAFARAGTLIRLYEGLDPENVEGAARAVAARAGEYDPVDLQLFVTAWAHLDPESAMREVVSWPIRLRRELGVRAVMREWAASGRQVEAGAYFDSLTDPALREVASGPLVRGWALGGDSEGALALSERFWHSEPRHDVVDNLVRGVLQARGPQGALALAKTVDPIASGEFGKKVILTTLDLAGQSDPNAAAAQYDALSKAAPEATWLAKDLPRLAGLLRNDDPRAALEWVIPKPEGPERSRALTETMGTWAKRDFDAAWAWFEQNREFARNPGPRPDATDSAILRGLVRRMARIRPAEAATWAVRLQPISVRVEMLRRVAYFWSATEPDRVDEWIAGLELRPQELAQVREAAEWGRSADDAGEGQAGSHSIDPESDD